MARKKLKICMLGHKRIPSREGGIEIVVEELATRMVALGHEVTAIIEVVIMLAERNLTSIKIKNIKV